MFISISSVVAVLLWLGVSEPGSLTLDVLGLLVELEDVSLPKVLFVSGFVTISIFSVVDDVFKIVELLRLGVSEPGSLTLDVVGLLVELVLISGPRVLFVSGFVTISIFSVVELAVSAPGSLPLDVLTSLVVARVVDDVVIIIPGFIGVSVINIGGV